MCLYECNESIQYCLLCMCVCALLFLRTHTRVFRCVCVLIASPIKLCWGQHFLYAGWKSRDFGWTKNLSREWKGLESLLMPSQPLDSCRLLRTCPYGPIYEHGTVCENTVCCNDNEYQLSYIWYSKSFRHLGHTNLHDFLRVEMESLTFLLQQITQC